MNQRIAIAAKYNATQYAKRYYDQNYRHASFQMGDLVLAKVMGRTSEAQMKYQGPYRVTAKNNAIYQIANVEWEKDKVERHVNDLRPFASNLVDSHDQTSNEATSNEPTSA